jgi:ADP-heptose:LPS heptosyltransferase
MTWTADGPQEFESRKIKYLLPRYTRGRGLEIGCGMEKAFPHFIGVDNGHHFGRGAAEIVASADNLALFADESMDFVFSSHVLEHMADMEAALREWARVIKPGGYLCLYVPSANLYPKCGEPGANPDHKHDIYPGDIEAILLNLPWEWLACHQEERGEGNEYSLLEIYQKSPPLSIGAHTVSEGPPGKIRYLTHSPQKTACVCRFGGFGDMLQAAVVFPQLKAQGYHVTVMTTPKGQDVLRHDPHVDDWYIVDQDQVPNGELTAFWAEQARRFDRFVNLSESIEGYLLALPGRPNHAWPQAVRHKRMNLNYHEWTAELAEVEFKPCRLFYPTPGEQTTALLRVGPKVPRGFRDQDRFNVLWALAGSSIHKFTPHQDAVIARMLLDMPEAHIFLVGDEVCKLLEQGWEMEPRVVCLSGGLSIRETLALAQQVDLVIGPETGVLNAVGMEKTPHKVLLLSHSSANNLSKHWQNVQALAPEDCPCHPCHRLHYSTEFCRIDEASGAALCALHIGPHAIYEAAQKVYRNWQKGRL